MMGKYRANIWPAADEGRFCYEVVNPEGLVTVRGTRRGERAEVQRQVNKFLRRAGLECGWQQAAMVVAGL